MISKVGLWKCRLNSLARFCVLQTAVHASTARPGRAWMGMGMSKVKVKVACFSHLAPSSVVSELGIA